MANPEGKNVIKLISCDNREFTVDKRIAFMSELIKQMCSVSNEFSRELAIPDVTGDILSKVIDFCTYHVDNPLKEIERPLKSTNMAENVDAWDAAYIDLDDATLFHLVTAANYLMIRPLMELACSKIASFIKGKTTEEIRQRFHIQSDFTPEEEEKIRQENKWADEL